MFEDSETKRLTAKIKNFESIIEHQDERGSAKFKNELNGLKLALEHYRRDTPAKIALLKERQNLVDAAHKLQGEMKNLQSRLVENAEKLKKLGVSDSEIPRV